MKQEKSKLHLAIIKWITQKVPKHYILSAQAKEAEKRRPLPNSKLSKAKET